MTKKRVTFDCIINVSDGFKHFDSLEYDIVRLLRESYPFEVYGHTFDIDDLEKMV